MNENGAGKRWKMGHTERISSNTAINIPGDKNQKLFQSGVDYFGQIGVYNYGNDKQH
jgi:hypothetical protein